MSSGLMLLPKFFSGVPVQCSVSRYSKRRGPARVTVTSFTSFSLPGSSSFNDRSPLSDAPAAITRSRMMVRSPFFFSSWDFHPLPAGITKMSSMAGAICISSFFSWPVSVTVRAQEPLALMSVVIRDRAQPLSSASASSPLEVARIRMGRWYHSAVRRRIGPSALDLT